MLCRTIGSTVPPQHAIVFKDLSFILKYLYLNKFSIKNEIVTKPWSIIILAMFNLNWFFNIF